MIKDVVGLFSHFNMLTWVSLLFKVRSDASLNLSNQRCHLLPLLGLCKIKLLQVTKNRYLDYGITRNATCHLTWEFIGVFESFLRSELKKTPHINEMA